MSNELEFEWICNEERFLPKIGKVECGSVKSGPSNIVKSYVDQGLAKLTVGSKKLKVKSDQSKKED